MAVLLLRFREVAILAGLALFEVSSIAAASERAYELRTEGVGIAKLCVAELTPTQTTGGSHAPKLSITFDSADNLTINVIGATEYTSIQFVQNNERHPLTKERIKLSYLSSSKIVAALKSGELFFITSQRQNSGEYVSSRYADLDFEDLLNSVEKSCPYDAEFLLGNRGRRQEIERNLRLNSDQLLLIRWALQARYTSDKEKPLSSLFLEEGDRSLIKRYTRENGIPVSRYLTSISSARLLAEGRKLEEEHNRTVTRSSLSTIFKACNSGDTTINLSLAVSETIAAPDKYRVSGWFEVKERNCTVLGPVSPGWVHVYGQVGGEDKGYFRESDVDLCVEYPGPFEKLIVAGANCGSGVRRGFRRIYVSGETYLLQLPATPTSSTSKSESTAKEAKSKKAVKERKRKKKRERVPTGCSPGSKKCGDRAKP